MRVSPCPCCNGAGHHPAGPCLYCSGGGSVTEHTWVHFCPNAGTPSSHSRPLHRTRRSATTTSSGTASVDDARAQEFLTTANDILSAARTGDDRIRELLARYDAEFVPLVQEVARGLSGDDVERLHVVVELLREQRAQLERLRELWALTRGLLADAALVDALEPGAPAVP